MAVRQGSLVIIMLAVLLFAGGLAGAVSAADSGGHSLIRGDDAQLRQWIAQYDAAPPVPVNVARQRALTSSTGSVNVIDLVPYVPEERHQGLVANCWAWAGTGVLEAAHTLGNGIRDRLSVQYLDSNFNGGSGPDWAGNGGSLADFVQFYSVRQIAVPWSNTNASYRDAQSWCVEHDSAWVPAASIATDPHYDILSIADERVQTRSVGSAQARANIKAVLEGGRAVYLAFRLPDQSAWDAFDQFWRTQPESAVFSPAPYDGQTWSATAGGHAVLVVGYDDTDAANPYWIVLNSWGTSNGQRPHGTFRLSMNLNYDGTYRGSFAIPSTEWQTLTVRFEDLPAPTPTPGVAPVPPSTSPPRDLNGDGLYEDVNGNGRPDFADVTLLYSAISWCAANEPISAFDFNGNGRIDFSDVVTLYGRL
jgi:PKD repeat protein